MNKYLHILKKARLKSNCKIKMSAIAVSGGRILAVASNMEGSSGAGEYQYSRHAEDNLLRLIRRIPSRTRVYLFVYRQHGTSGRRLLARPCKKCRRVLAKANIKRVWYTTEDGWVEERL